MKADIRKLIRKSNTRKRYGYWTVIGFNVERRRVGHRERLWKCRCDCGIVKDVGVYDLRRGRTRSCGCKQGRPRVHGLCDSPTYKSWLKMRERCADSKNKDYSNYGGRGIRVCDRWRTSFINFLADMGLRPEGETIDRIDGNGGYNPENCQWLDRGKNSSKRRTDLTHNGKIQSISAWAREYGMSYSALYKRLKKWPLERALNTPLDKSKQRKKE